jgi:hypothetical protein
MKQEQTGGDGTTNNQAGGDIIYTGLSVEQLTEIKKHVSDEVALQVEHQISARMEAVQGEFVKYTGEANAHAMATAQHLLSTFVEQLATKAPQNIDSIKSVAMQQSILNAQTSAAVADDDQLTETLVDILIDKSDAEPRSFKGVVLNEALAVAGKLTADQVDLLTALVIITNTVLHDLNTLDLLIDGLDKRCRPLYGKIPESDKALQYMGYTGVGDPGMLVQDIFGGIARTYNGVLTQGFTVDQLPEGLQPRFESLPEVDARIATAPGRRRFPIASSQTLDLYPHQVPRDPLFVGGIAAIKSLIEQSVCPPEKFRAACPTELAQFLETLDRIDASSFRLSSVGIAIGQANWRRLQPELAPKVDIYLS